MRSSISVLMLGTIFLLGAGATQPASDSSNPDRVRTTDHHLQAAKDAYDRTLAEQDKAATVLAELRTAISNQSGRIEVSSEGIRQAIQKLEEQQEQLQLEEAGAAGRRRGLEEAVKKYTEMAKARGDSDPVVAELEKVVAVRERALARMQQLFKQGVASDADASAAEVAVAQSNAELAAAKQKAAEGTGINEALEAWNRESMNLTIEALDREARLTYLNGRLQQLQRAVGSLQQLDQATHALTAAEAEVMSARRRLEQLRIDHAIDSASESK